MRKERVKSRQNQRETRDGGEIEKVSLAVGGERGLPYFGFTSWVFFVFFEKRRDLLLLIRLELFFFVYMSDPRARIDLTSGSD